MTDRKTILFAILVAVSLAAASVPATAQEGGDSMEMTITITADAEIETAEVVWETDAETYESMQMWAESQDYETVAEWFAEESMVGDGSGFEDYGETNDRELEDGYAIEVEFTEFNDSEFDDMNLTAEDGIVTFESADLDDPENDEMFSEITYVVDMPGEITASNAHEVDGSVATWYLHENSTSSISVESDTSSDEEDADDDGLPGFGAGAAAVGALVAVALLARRSD